MPTHGPSPSTADDELDDATVGRMVRRGVLIGIPAVYAISLLIALPGAGWPAAPLIAILPALFAGPWLGSTIMLLTHRAATLPARAGTVVPLDEVPPVAPRSLDRAA